MVSGAILGSVATRSSRCATFGPRSVSRGRTSRRRVSPLPAPLTDPASCADGRLFGLARNHTGKRSRRPRVAGRRSPAPPTIGEHSTSTATVSAGSFRDQTPVWRSLLERRIGRVIIGGRGTPWPVGSAAHAIPVGHPLYGLHAEPPVAFACGEFLQILIDQSGFCDAPNVR
jgi:hypothetical protein